MSTPVTQVSDWRQQITVECSFQPLPPTQRLRALMIIMTACVRNRFRFMP